MRVSLPVFVLPEVDAKPVLRWQATRTSQGDLKVSLTNNGNAHIQIANFKLSLPGSAQPWVTKQSSEYVLPGQSRDWNLRANAEYPAPPPGVTLQLFAQTDAGDIEAEVIDCDLDVHQAGIVAHKINASKSLNARLLLLAMLTLTPSAALAEDTALALDEVFLAVLINQQPQGIVFLLRSDDRLFAGSKICGAGACACLIRPRLPSTAKTSTHLMRWQACRTDLMNLAKR